MASHSSTFAWKIPWTEKPGRLQSMVSLESATTERLYFHFSLSCIGEGNDNPLQCSCPENPRDGEAWWAAVYGVAQSRTQLKWLSNNNWCEKRTHLKRPWCWERLKAWEEDDWGWDGWMASPIQWTQIWANSRSCWWTGRPDVLQSMLSQRVGHDWTTELSWMLFWRPSIVS